LFYKNKLYIHKTQCVREFSNEDRIKLLVFATGNSQVPVTGFKDLQNSDGIQHFKLKKTGEEEDLPTSHTWYIIYISINFIYLFIFIFFFKL